MRCTEIGGPTRPRVARRRISRTRRVSLGRLSAAEREALCRDAYAIYSQYKVGVERATFDRQFFGDDEARVALFLGDDGALVGFACASIARMAHAGRVHAVYSALLFVDTRYSGTREAKKFALAEALRFKLREPWTPLAYMGVVTTPASYRMFAVAMPTFYPNRHAPAPAPVTALVREAATRRGLAFEDDERWLVRGLGEVRQPERLRGAASLQGDPDARFYLDANPRFAAGVAMLLWVPLDLGNLFGALARLLGVRAG